jgi:hypothetical protein
MATGSAKSTDAAKTMVRGKPEKWLSLTNRSLSLWVDGESASRACFKRGPLDGEVDR